MRATQLSTRIAFAWLLAGMTLPLLAQNGSPPLHALKMIERGMWELREKNKALPPQKVCVRDPMLLTQVRHGAAICSRFVVENESKRGTVYYTCPGAGHGQTTVRVEGPKLLQLDSQGIADQSPFNFSYEARHVGACH